MIVLTGFYYANSMSRHDLFDEVIPHINLIGGTISGDDTIIDKPYSEQKLVELIGYFYSGKHHRTVKGIQLITEERQRAEGRREDI